MLRKIVIYFLLFNFINTVLFYNNEGDHTNTSQKILSAQHGEINSLVEYVVEGCLDIQDDTPEDEDDDWSDPFKTEKRDICSAPVFGFVKTIELCNWSNTSNFPNHTSFFSKVCLDKNSPPPKHLC